MPIYEYLCDHCGHRFEKIQKVSDPPCKKCPNCGSSLRKLISSAAIQFKGSGFYITDYPRKTGSSQQDKPAKSPGEVKEKAKKDAPAAAKPEPSTPKTKSGD